MIEIRSTSAGGGDDGVHHTGVWMSLLPDQRSSNQL